MYVYPLLENCSHLEFPDIWQGLLISTKEWHKGVWWIDTLPLKLLIVESLATLTIRLFNLFLKLAQPILQDAAAYHYNLFNTKSIENSCMHTSLNNYALAATILQSHHYHVWCTEGMKALQLQCTIHGKYWREKFLVSHQKLVDDTNWWIPKIAKAPIRIIMHQVLLVK